MFRRVLLISGVALAACVSHTDSSELTGLASLAIANVPSDVSCIQVSAANSVRSVADSFDVTAGQSTVLELDSLPTGTVTFTGTAYATSCAQVTSASTPDWVGPPVTAAINSTSPTPLTLTLVPNGQSALTVNFDGDGGGASCPTGQSTCAGSCTDVSTDPANCGSCGAACAAGFVCTAGACTCPVGELSCGGVCVDPATDPANCGSCDSACPSGLVCTSGTCGCPTGDSACGGSCTDTQTDPANCGGCGLVCQAGSACSAGACTP
jgi:hypothetical protein